MYRLLIRPILFLFPPEAIHHFVFASLKFLHLIPGMRVLLRSVFCVSDPNVARELMGLRFPNPVGLAAGFDKDAKGFRELSSLGFGFIEVGTVTPQPQPGNDKPRMFRLKKDSALINRMGFNNEGVKKMAVRLRNRKPGLIIGGNIGKNKVTPNESAVDDYVICFRELYHHVDYFVVNVSSPNTPGLRSLQEKEPLMLLLGTLQKVNDELGEKKPVLLKISPDLNTSQLDEIVEVVRESGLSGIVATNTTLSREGLLSSPGEIEAAGAGGLSGKPLTGRSTEVVRYLRTKAGKDFVIIAVGGIHTPEDAEEKIKAGADLVQLYTGFIYEGPSLIKRIIRKIP